MTVTAEIDIYAPKEIVREVFLDFLKLRDWHDGSFFEFIQVVGGADEPVKAGKDLKEGDRLRVRIPGMTFEPTVTKNTPDTFQWLGSIPYILSGPHSFDFIPHADSPSPKTTFRQTETFTGLLAPLMNLFGGKTAEGWERVNRDIKVEAEKRWKAQQPHPGV